MATPRSPAPLLLALLGLLTLAPGCLAGIGLKNSCGYALTAFARSGAGPTYR
jgi:hypothetical protein